MTAFDLKILAFTFMFIDHIGRIFMDGSPVLLGLGRLSFPLFAWLAAQGEIYTSNIRHYVLRLLAIGLITQPIYLQIWQSLFPNTIAPWNILFTLAFGVVALRFIRRFENPVAQVPVFILLAGLGEFLRIEGGSSAILSLGAIAQFEANKPWSNAFWYGLLIALEFLYIALFQNSAIELCGLVAPLLLLWYNGEQGHKAKWFYLLYPLHFLGFWVTKQYLLPYLLPLLQS
jgi:TraX protein